MDFGRHLRSIEVPHAAQCVLHLDLPNCLACMAFDLLEQLSLCWDDFFEGGFEIRLGGGGVPPSRRQ